MTTDIAEGLLRYFETRKRQRADAVVAAVEALTDRERALVREAAVMGYVRGVRAAGGYSADAIPPDSAIVTEVVDACLAMPDLYPTIARAGNQP